MDYTTTTTASGKDCKHEGWIKYIKFWIFEKKILVCEKCGDLIYLK